MMRFLVVIVTVGLAGAAHAASNGSITFTGGLDPLEPAPGVCGDTHLAADFTATADNDDGGGLDWIALITLDADGTPVDTDFLSYASPGAISDSNSGALDPINVVGSRPVTIALFDITDPGVLDEDTPAGFSFAVNGTFLAEDSVDPASATALCFNLPLRAAAFSFAPQTATPVPTMSYTLLVLVGLSLVLLSRRRLQAHT